MGSVLSFPILCLVNFIAYYRSLRRYCKEEGVPLPPLDELPVLVNGDDICFMADEDLYTIWQEEIQVCGFQLSVGKNYRHPTVVTMNSQMYKATRSYDRCSEGYGDPTSIHIVPYLNTGLLIGQSKLGTDGSEKPLWDIYEKAVVDSPDPVRSHGRFLGYHREWIERVTKGGLLNLYIPRNFGGLGFTPIGPFKVTNLQRALCSIYRQAYSGLTANLVSTVRCSARTEVVPPKPSWNGKLYHLYPVIGPLPERAITREDQPLMEFTSAFTDAQMENKSLPSFLIRKARRFLKQGEPLSQRTIYNLRGFKVVSGARWLPVPQPGKGGLNLYTPSRRPFTGTFKWESQDSDVLASTQTGTTDTPTHELNATKEQTIQGSGREGDHNQIQVHQEGWEEEQDDDEDSDQVPPGPPSGGAGSPGCGCRDGSCECL
jgi:hypothetical protein